MVAGENVAVAPVGKPVAVNVTASGSFVPELGASVKVKLAIAPGATVAEVVPVPAPVEVSRVKGNPTVKLVFAVAGA
jgi:hypothetical protein